MRPARSPWTSVFAEEGAGDRDGVAGVGGFREGRIDVGFEEVTMMRLLARESPSPRRSARG
jgi:hypothetical protein